MYLPLYKVADTPFQNQGGRSVVACDYDLSDATLFHCLASVYLFIYLFIIYKGIVVDGWSTLSQNWVNKSCWKCRSVATLKTKLVRIIINDFKSHTVIYNKKHPSCASAPGAFIRDNTIVIYNYS